jgi:hypothetical protein
MQDMAKPASQEASGVYGNVFTSAMTGNAALLAIEIGRGDLAGASRALMALLLSGLIWERLRHASPEHCWLPPLFGIFSTL